MLIKSVSSSWRLRHLARDAGDAGDAGKGVGKVLERCWKGVEDSMQLDGFYQSHGDSY